MAKADEKSKKVEVQKSFEVAEKGNLPLSKNGVAIFPEGQHPKDRQLAAKRLAEAKAEPVEAALPKAHESVVDQMPRSTRMTEKEAAAEGKKLQGQLEAAEKLDSGELDKEEEQAKKDAQEAHDKKVKDAEAAVK